LNNLPTGFLNDPVPPVTTLLKGKFSPFNSSPSLVTILVAGLPGGQYKYYNQNHLHSAHRYRTPAQAEKEYYKNRNSHKNVEYLGRAKTYLSHM
jgi:hypothetical protein